MQGSAHVVAIAEQMIRNGNAQQAIPILQESLRFNPNDLRLFHWLTEAFMKVC